MIDQWRETSQSTLGIEYDEFVGKRFVTVLLQAEQEWLYKATETYSDDAWEVWAQDIFPRLIEQTLQQVDIDDLRNYAPETTRDQGISKALLGVCLGQGWG